MPRQNASRDRVDLRPPRPHKISCNCERCFFARWKREISAYDSLHRSDLQYAIERFEAGHVGAQVLAASLRGLAQRLESIAVGVREDVARLAGGAR